MLVLLLRSVSGLTILVKQFSQSNYFQKILETMVVQSSLSLSLSLSHTHSLTHLLHTFLTQIIKTNSTIYLFFKWAVRGFFLFIFVFSLQFKVSECRIRISNDWISTGIQWCRRQLICQLLCHNQIICLDTLNDAIILK